MSPYGTYKRDSPIARRARRRWDQIRGARGRETEWARRGYKRLEVLAS
jgi:hypothetical protein